MNKIKNSFRQLIAASFVVGWETGLANLLADETQKKDSVITFIEAALEISHELFYKADTFLELKIQCL